MRFAAPFAAKFRGGHASIGLDAIDRAPTPLEAATLADLLNSLIAELGFARGQILALTLILCPAQSNNPG